MILPHVAVLHVHFQYGRQATAVPCGKSTFGDAHLLHRIGIEYREKTEQMAHAVERPPVQYDEVLIGTASPNVKPRSSFATRLHPRHQLQTFQQVHFSANRRQPSHLVHGDFHLGHLHLIFNAVEALACHDGFLNRYARGQLHVHLLIFLEIEFIRLRLKTDE